MPFDDDTDFLRGIHPDWFNFQTQQIESWAFDNHPQTPNRMSVNWAEISSVEETIKYNPSCGVASITAKVCYQENQEIEHTPQDDNPAHCDVIGRKTLAIKRRLRNAAILLLAPTESTPPER